MNEIQIAAIAAGAICVLLLAALFCILAARREQRRAMNRLRQTSEQQAKSVAQLTQALTMTQNQLNELTQRQDRLRDAVDQRMDALRRTNEHQLDQMRETVAEKLDSRLTESFRTVNRQLADVHRGLGEMHELAGEFSDLKKILGGVKTRGVWGEMQLRALLEQILAPDQYIENAAIPAGSQTRVEFAVRLPATDGEALLPIDSKFPQEDYLRLQAAADGCDKAAVEESEKALAKIIKDEAATISRLYINVPKTTNFAIMFLPTEGLYAEVLRQNGLVEEIQRKYSVMICGPTTISAFLNTLRVGFRTIAIDKQQAEVWKILGAAKQQYATFETVLEKAEKKINEAGNVLSDARKRNGIIQRKLNKVEDISQADSNEILGIEEG